MDRSIREKWISSIRVNESEQKLILDAANHCGLTVGSFVRLIMLKYSRKILEEENPSIL